MRRMWTALKPRDVVEGRHCIRVKVTATKSAAHASVEHVESHPTPENVASVVTFTSIWWLSPFHLPNLVAVTFSPPIARGHAPLQVGRVGGEARRRRF